MADYLAQLILGPRIGGGHFGHVHEATCPLHGQVAVKLLQQLAGESNADYAARSRSLLAEGIRLKSAQHQNVVGVHQVLQDSSGVVHLVTEFCDGGSLQNQYEANPLSLYEVRKIITDVCAGLDCLHAANMVHRDIKPANIFCHRTTYKLGDFGLVTDRMIHGYASGNGYISHLAPEVFDSSGGTIGVTSAKTDIWALGMTIYRLLHGHQFFIDNFVAVNFKTKITSGGFSRSLPWLPHIPDKWRKFVRKAMHDDSAQRFQNAHEMSQALASLPIEPRWNCQYAFNRRVWARMEDGRRITVEWLVPSPRKHAWSATRSGGGKRNLTLAGTSGAFISGSLAQRQLEGFFDNQ